MYKKELCQSICHRVCDMHMCLVSSAEFLPDSYLDDMKALFNADPESDTASNVHWGYDLEGYVPDGVITVIDGVNRDEACERLVQYAKDHKIPELHLLAKDGEGNYIELICDDSGEEFYAGSEVMIAEDGAAWDGFLTIYLNDWKIGL